MANKGYTGKSGDKIREKGVFSFDYFMYNYGRFHDNSVNQLIHLVFIPTIFVTALIIFYHYTAWEELATNPLIDRFNYFDIYFLILFPCFFYVDVVVGFFFGLWSVPLICIAHALVENKELYTLQMGETNYSLLYVASVINIAAWIAQFWGHGFHEGRAPALMTNLLFANFAVFFVTFEVINHVFGYGEGPRLEVVRKAIKADI